MAVRNVQQSLVELFQSMYKFMGVTHLYYPEGVRIHDVPGYMKKCPTLARLLCLVEVTCLT